jgi:4-aminobutyrate aminotransferase-like enzyme
MGDVHPHPLKAQLARELSRITFERWTASTRPKLSAKTVFCNSGFEAVECALKTALLATRRPGVLAFEGAYHGLGYGALNTTHRDEFRRPFRPQLAEFGTFIPFPSTPAELDRSLSLASRNLRSGRFGAILVEPIQGRGGIRVPPQPFLQALRQLADEHEALLILDEIYTGFGRTGAWFACEHAAVVPDIICLGKALTGGFPLSACVGRRELMDHAWPASTGEAIHTSTFLGNPVGCAMALAQIREIERLNLPKRAALRGKQLLHLLQDLADEANRIDSRRQPLRLFPRGCGLMIGLEILKRGLPATAEALRLVKAMLRSGFILLPEGARSHVLGFTPPLTLTTNRMLGAVDALRHHLLDPNA